MSADGQGTKSGRKTAENYHRLSRVQERYRQTDGRAIAYSEREREFTFAKKWSDIQPEPIRPTTRYTVHPYHRVESLTPTRLPAAMVLSVFIFVFSVV